jgi:hypothetical protein
MPFCSRKARLKTKLDQRHRLKLSDDMPVFVLLQTIAFNKKRLLDDCKCCWLYLVEITQGGCHVLPLLTPAPCHRELAHAYLYLFD